MNKMSQLIYSNEVEQYLIVNLYICHHFCGKSETMYDEKKSNSFKSSDLNVTYELHLLI